MQTTAAQVGQLLKLLGIGALGKRDTLEALADWPPQSLVHRYQTVSAGDFYTQLAATHSQQGDLGQILKKR